MVKTAIAIEEKEIKTAILEYVKKEYNITLRYESIKIEVGKDNSLIVGAEIQRETKSEPISNYRNK